MKKLLLLLAILIGLSLSWYQFCLTPVDASDHVNRHVQIFQGSSVTNIAEQLQISGLIRSARAFRIYVRIHGDQSLLQAGDFILQPSMSVPQIVETLRRGFSEQVAVTIPEGYTVRDIDALLVKKALGIDGEFAACSHVCDLSGIGFLPVNAAAAQRGGRVEGYLFPDTYFVVREGFTPQKFMIRLLGNFRARVIDKLASEISASKRSLTDIITMASLVEEESRDGEERPVVAGILWKRFDGKQGLGVDAALRYILDKPSAAITEKDLALDSPYNLRKFRGLPPGPISNPSISSILAALHPTDSKYWYYLHDRSGAIHYAVTNDEHNQNKALYLR